MTKITTNHGRTLEIDVQDHQPGRYHNIEAIHRPTGIHSDVFFSMDYEAAKSEALADLNTKLGGGDNSHQPDNPDHPALCPCASAARAAR